MHDYGKLVKGCVKQRPKAQRRLFEMFEGMVMGVCLRYSGTRAEAEDVLQEVFIKVFKNLDTLSDPQALPRWVHQTAVRTAINGHHRDKKHRYHLEVSHAEEEPAPYEDALDRLSNAQLIELIDQLPDGYRVVFNLAVVDGFSHREIAETLGISEATSRSQLVRAKQHLQRSLRHLGITRYEKSI
ncbi:MAG: sigma-70 family RNA polymerase sigma factor [Bacteroidota bacterium]